MKKFILLTISFLCVAIISQGQISKGSVLLGGGISGGSKKSDNGINETKSSSFGISPAVGLAVKENSVLGIRLMYSTSRSEEIATGRTQNANGYIAGLFFRRYKALGKDFFLFGEGALNYSVYQNKYKNNNPNPTYSQTSHSISLNLYPGIAYAASKRFHLEVALNNLVNLDYGWGKTETMSNSTTSSTKNSGFGFSTNLNTAAPLTVGFRFVLAK